MEVYDTVRTADSEQPHYDNMMEVLQTIEYQTYKDRYHGDIDPVTKLRHGQGTYTYHENPFFQYQGGYDSGIKQSNSNASAFVMRDGTIIVGDFKDGEISGRAIKKYPDGHKYIMYQGEFVEGEFNGYGKLSYNTNLKSQADAEYVGTFNLNSRVGKGRLTKKNGDVFDGEFTNNHPNGLTQIFFANGDKYEGEVIKSVMTGQGFLQCTDGRSYRGKFKEGKLHGEGKFFVENGTYSLEGNYTEGQPEYVANKFLLKVVSPVEEEEDPKAKKDAKKPPVPEENEGGNEIKILIDTCNPNEEQKKLSFTMTVVFQGESYEDPNPPEEDEAAKKKKGKDAEPEIRMITPDPVVLEKENGREFEIQLGRNQKVISQESVMESVKESDNKPPADGDQSQQPDKEEWVQYKFDQSKDELTTRVCTTNGVISIEGLTYQFEEGKFESGAYEIVITDVTKGIDEDKLLPPMRLDIKIIDSEAEAELAAAQAAAGKGKKK